MDAGPGDGRGVPSGRSLIGVAGVDAPAKGGTPMLRVIPEDDARQELVLALDEICRRGAERMLALALEAEVDAYLERHREARDGRGHALVVRNGSARARTVVAGAGAIAVGAPRRWPRSCPCCTCTGCPPRTSCRPWQSSSAPPPGCRRRPSPDSRPPGPPSGRPS